MDEPLPGFQINQRIIIIWVIHFSIMYLGTEHNHHRVIGHPSRPGLGLEEGEVVEGGGSLLDKDPPPGQLSLELRDPLDLELAHLGRVVQGVRVEVKRGVRAGREGGSLQQPSLLV